MKIIVTGAGGFIGRHLCEELSAHGHSVKAVVRRPPESPLKADETLVLPDFQAIKTSMLQDCECLIHLAARAHILKEKTADPLPEFREANVAMARRWVEMAGRAGVKRFVLVSSGGVNGLHTQGIPFTETDQPKPAEPYAISKLEAETMLREVAGGFGMEYVIVRPTLVYGPDAPGNFALLLKLAAKGWPMPFGGVQARRNMVSVWNLADFLRLCCEHPAAADQLFLVADREETTLPEIFRYLGEGFGKPNPMLPFPPALLAFAAKLAGKGKAYAKLTAEFRVDTSKARELLGWIPPYSATDGLRRTGREFSK